MDYVRAENMITFKHGETTKPIVIEVNKHTKVSLTPETSQLTGCPYVSYACRLILTDFIDRKEHGNVLEMH